MDLKYLKNTLDARFTIFRSLDAVKYWVKEQKIGFFDSGESIIKAAQQYINERYKTIISQINEDLEVYSFNYIYDVSYNIAGFDKYELKSGAIGGIGGAALLLMLEGAIFWPAAIVSGIAGVVIGNKHKINKIAEKIYYNANESRKKILQQLNQFIDGILEKVETPRLYIEPPKDYLSVKDFLNLEQIEIKEFLEKRNINWLVHFTDKRNVESIKKHGILSISQLNNRGIKYWRNDENRFDNKLDYISLSITNMNEALMKSYKHCGKIDSIVVLRIDASILWREIEKKRVYCETNAATTNANKGSSIEDLEKMFAETVSYSNSSGQHYYDRRSKRIASYETTDPQAEILFEKEIPVKYIYFGDEKTNDIEDDLPF